MYNTYSTYNAYFFYSLKVKFDAFSNQLPMPFPTMAMAVIRSASQPHSPASEM